MLSQGKGSGGWGGVLAAILIPILKIIPSITVTSVHIHKQESEEMSMDNGKVILLPSSAVMNVQSTGIPTTREN